MSDITDISKAKPSVTSVVQALAILRYLSRTPNGAGVTAIASSVSVSPSSCFNILKTLVAEEYLEFSERTKIYRLGLGAIELARHTIGIHDPVPVLEPHLREVAIEFDAAIGLWRLQDRKRLVMVGAVQSDRQTRIHMSLGQRVPTVAGAIGCCVAANLDMSNDEIAAGLEASRWQSRPSLDEFLRLVEQARRFGWSIDVGKWLHGLTNVAAPVVNSNGKFVFGITATTLVGQHDHITVQTMCEKIGDLGKYASKRLFGGEMAKSA